MKSGMFWVLCGCALGAAAACSSNDSSSSGGNADFGGGFYDASASIGGSTSGGIGNGGFSSGTGGLPPEVEVNVDFELPHAGEHYVYAANPDGDTVSVIDATTLAIQTVEAGDRPTFLQTLGGKDAAIVLNVASDDATVIRTADTGLSTTTKVKVAPGSNAIAVEPSGRYAVVYFDESHSSYSATPGSFQDVTIVALDPAGDVATPMTVGYRPSRVFFSNTRDTGYVVTEDGVSILDLSAKTPGIAETVPLGDNSQTLDVTVTPDGAYALAREQGSSELRLVSLESGNISTIDLAAWVPEVPEGDSGTPGTDSGAPGSDSGIPGPDSGGPGSDSGAVSDAGTDGAAADAGTVSDGAAPVADSAAPSPAPTTTTPSLPAPAPPPLGPVTVTDVDMSPAGDFALAVLRERSTVLRIPIPGGFTDPSTVRATTVATELIGSVTISPDVRYALLYTTADPTNERLSILDLSADTVTKVQLRKSVRSVAVSPDSVSALVVHQKLPGDPNDVTIDDETRTDRKYGYSAVRLSDGFPKIQITAADPGPSTIVPDGTHLFVLFNAPGVSAVQNMDLRSFVVSSVTLGSPPVSVGAVPGSSRVFVGQDHPDGRISFIDWQTNAVQSVTGFALNSRIRE